MKEGLCPHFDSYSDTEMSKHIKTHLAMPLCSMSGIPLAMVEGVSYKWKSALPGFVSKPL